MTRELQDAIEVILDKVDDLAEDLARGAVKIEDYKYVVGQIRGLRTAVSLIEGVKDEEEEDD